MVCSRALRRAHLLLQLTIPGTREAVLDGETGLLVPTNDDQALAAAISSSIFTDQTLRERIVEGGSKILKEKFSWEGHIQKLEGMFKNARFVDRAGFAERP
jgi:glycosyltransferase involved in cell wall biosynthesis